MTTFPNQLAKQLNSFLTIPGRVLEADNGKLPRDKRYFPGG